MKKTKTYPNERLQLNDYEAVAKLVLDELIRSNRVLVLPQGRATGAAATSSRILDGFNFTNVVGGTFRLTRGSGFFGYFDQGVLKQGILVGEDSPAYYDIDLSALPDDDYFVYVRMVYNQTDAENRIFWNPTGTPVEYVDNVPTRDTPSWEYAVQAASVAPPGHGEWVKLWGVTVAAGVITAVQDLRPFFFEGDAFGAGFGQEWGAGTNDRSENRSSYGVADLHLFCQAMRTQVGEIIGLYNTAVQPAWYKQRQISLADLFLSHYGRATPTYPGNHKSPLKLGVPGANEWHLDVDSYTFGSYQKLRLIAGDVAGDPEAYLEFFDGGSTWVHIDPIPGAPLASDVHLKFGTDFGITFLGDGSGHNFLMDIVSDGTNPDLRLIAGHGTVSPGLYLGCESVGGPGDDEGGYYLTPRTVTVPVPLRMLAQDPTIGGGWYWANYDPTGAGGLCCPAAHTDAYCRMEYHHLPHLAVVNYIDVMWSQAAVGGGNNMRLHAYRHRIGWTALGDKPLLTNTSDLTGLGAVDHFVEYAFGATNICNIQRFTCGAAPADRTFQQRFDKLVLTPVGAVGGHDCYIYWIRVNFTYQLAQPFPVAGAT